MIAGGEQRHLSVECWSPAVNPTDELVAVHDGARPLISSDIISLAIREARAYGAVSVAAPIVETLKRANEEQQVIGAWKGSVCGRCRLLRSFAADGSSERMMRCWLSGVPVTDEVSAIQTAGFPVKLLTNPGWT